MPLHKRLGSTLKIFGQNPLLSNIGMFIRDNPLLTGVSLGAAVGSVVAGTTLIRRKRKSGRRKSKRKSATRQRRRRKATRRRITHRTVRRRRKRITHSSPRHRGHKRVSFTTKGGKKVSFLTKR